MEGGLGARRSGLPDLRIYNADLGQARDRCAVTHQLAESKTVGFAPLNPSYRPFTKETP